MHHQLLQRRLYSLDTFWCHKMHPTRQSFAEKIDLFIFFYCVPSLVSVAHSYLEGVLYPSKVPCPYKL